MKRAFAIAAALCLTLALAACQKKEVASISCPAAGDRVTFTAAIEELGENSLLALADENAPVRNSSDRFSVGLAGAELLDEEGKGLEPFDLRLWDRVEIDFDGYIRETYPAQITASRVTRLPKEKLTLDRVKELAQKGETLDWVDFAPYESIETGSGLYILYFGLEEDYFVLVGGVPGEKAWYVKLNRKGEDRDGLDLRTDGARIDSFLAGESTVSAGAADYPAAIQVEGKVYLLAEQPSPMEVDDSAVIGHTSSYTDGWPQQDGETNFSRELGLPYARVEGGIALLYQHEWYFCDMVK